MLTDEQTLQDGLNKVIEDNKDETGTKRRRLDTLEKLIAKRQNSIQRLMNELNEGAYEDEYTRNIFRQTIKSNGDMINELEKEYDALKAELVQVEITSDFRRDIEDMAVQIKDNLEHASFDGKRAVLDKLDVKVVFRVDGDTKWIDASCCLTSSPESVELLRF